MEPRVGGGEVGYLHAASAGSAHGCGWCSRECAELGSRSSSSTVEKCWEHEGGEGDGEVGMESLFVYSTI